MQPLPFVVLVQLRLADEALPHLRRQGEQCTGAASPGLAEVIALHKITLCDIIADLYYMYVTFILYV